MSQHTYTFTSSAAAEMPLRDAQLLEEVGGTVGGTRAFQTDAHALPDENWAYQAEVLADDPTLYWRLGVNGLTDKSGNGRHGGNVGGMTIGGEPNSVTADDNATYFNGTNQRVSSTYQPFQAGTTLTFEGWAYRYEQTNYHTLFANYNTNELLFLDAGGNTVRLRVAGVDAAWIGAWPGTGQWVHWVVVYSDPANSATLYINGESKGAQGAGAAWATNTEFSIGHSSYGAWWPGWMDEVAVYGYGMGEAAVDRHYAAASI